MPATAAIRPAGMWYQFIQIRPERFFGVERVWVGEARVSITSLERTLLDGLAMPRYCGGFGEVVYAFGEALPQADIDRMVADAPRLGVAVAKRLGWVLETHGIEDRYLEQLAALPVKGYRKLDANGTWQRADTTDAGCCRRICPGHPAHETASSAP